MKRSLGLLILVGFFALSLGGCACVKKEVKSEPPPPEQVRAAEPMPVKPLPPPKKDRN
jgi:hypothetical protein